MDTKNFKRTENDWIVRVSSSQGTGGGHVNRCLNLARPLSSHARVIFALDANGENWFDYIKKSGFEAICEPFGNRLKAKACIIDLRDGSKDFMAKWGRQINFIACFSDVSKPPRGCNVEIGGPFLATSSFSDATYLAGPNYALVNPKYHQVGPSEVREKVEKLTIAFGLHDTANATSKILLAIKKLERDTLFKPKSILVYLGGTAPHLQDVRRHVETFSSRAKLVVDSDCLLAGLKDCDLAIGAGGVGMFERAAAGVPSLTFTIADNQIENANGGHAAKITMHAGDVRRLNPAELGSAIQKIVENKDLRRELGLLGPRLIDGSGALRLAEALRHLAGNSSATKI